MYRVVCDNDRLADCWLLFSCCFDDTIPDSHGLMDVQTMHPNISTEHFQNTVNDEIQQIFPITSTVCIHQYKIVFCTIYLPHK